MTDADLSSAGVDIHRVLMELHHRFPKASIEVRVRPNQVRPYHKPRAEIRASVGPGHGLVIPVIMHCGSPADPMSKAATWNIIERMSYALRCSDGRRRVSAAENPPV